MIKKWMLFLLMALLLPAAAYAWAVPKEMLISDRQALPAGIQEQLPDDMQLHAAIQTESMLHVWMEDAQRSKKLYVYQCNEESCTLLSQSPLLGRWNGFPPSIGYSGEGFCAIDYANTLSYSFRDWGDGRWALCTVYYYWPQSHFITFYPQAVFEVTSERVERRIVYGDVTSPMYLDTLDTAQVPETLHEALSRIDTEGWAMVQSTSAGSLTALYAAPDTQSETLGQYYTGAPVQVLTAEQDWCRVTIAGQEGWLAADALVFGEAMYDVIPELPILALRAEALQLETFIYQAPSTDSEPVLLTAMADMTIDQVKQSLFVVGQVNTSWYHVINWYGVSGYVQMQWFFEGNG